MVFKNYKTSFFLLLLVTCSPQPQPLPESANFREYIEVVSQRMCHKMHSCYAKIFRTLPGAISEKIDGKQCVSTVLKNSDYKIPLHTPKMKLLSVACYNAILEAPCKSFGEVAFFQPECIELNYMADQAYKGQKAPLENLPWD